MSGIQVLSIETLKDYDDGLLAAAFMANLRAVIADLNERPSDDRARKLILEMAFGTPLNQQVHIKLYQLLKKMK